MTSVRPQWRPLLVTAIDAGIIVAAAAAIVIALGGRTRFSVAATLVVLRSPVNPALAAVALGIVRLLLGRGLRPLPSIPRPDMAPMALERERLMSPSRPTRDVVLLGAATALGSLVWIVPHLLHPRWVPDAGDPLFSAWRIARIAHQLTTDPRHLFDGNIFYPLPFTLTLSDATFLQALVGAPFVLAGIDPLLVANALTMIAFPACGLAFFVAGWRITGDPRAGVIAGLLGALYPFHAEHYPHLELHWVMFAPLAIYTGMRALADPRPATGARFGLAVGLQWLSSMYLGVMLVSFLVPFLAIVALGWRVRLARPTLIAAATAVAVALPAFAVTAVPFLMAKDVRGERGRQEILDGSAMPIDYGHAHIRMVTYRWQDGRRHKGERELFPGTSTLALAAAGAIPPLSAASMASLVAGAFAFDGSLGLNGLTYDELARLSPAYRGMRAMSRFSVIVGVALVLLGAAGAARLFRRLPARARPAACAVLSLVVLFDLHIDPRVGPYPQGIPSIYSRVTEDMVLVELPVDSHIDYMYYSTFHWARLLGGYSGYPKYSRPVFEGWKVWPSAASLDYFREAGATHLTYNCALDRPWRCAVVFELLDSSPGLELIASGLWQGKEARLYRFKN